MPVPMSKEEIEITIERMRGINDSVPDAHYDRVIERMCNYIDANLDDFMECFNECEDDEQPYDIYLKKS